MTARPVSFTAGLITSLAGLVLAFNPEFWWGSPNPVGQAGLALIVVGAVIAVIGAVRSPTHAKRILGITVALIPPVAVLAYIALRFSQGH